MNESITKLQSTLKQKQQVLEHAKKTLKTEFAGIDQVIDRIFEWIGPWYLFPNMQESPLIINLWGMTGVGKSSLVNRLVELLDFSNSHYRFDMGEIDKDSNMNIRDQLKDMAIRKTPEPFVISFDEFQHARTISENKTELEKKDSRIVWNLLDNGRFDIDIADSFELRKLSNLISKIEYSVNMGIKAVDGEVIEKKELHHKNYFFFEWFGMNENEKKELEKQLKNEKMFLVDEGDYSSIYKSAPELFKDRFSVEDKFKKMDETETLRFLNKCLDIARKPKTIDCSLSLIFVIGNLDEAYQMSNEFSPELSADEFHRISKKINITTIKKALKERFRSEQIARLGNNHIIYPALSCDSYRKIIKIELDRINRKVNKKHGIRLGFEESVVDLIYNEGVYPTQGTRPVFSTIHQIINTKLSGIFSGIILHSLDPDEIVFQYKTDMMIIKCLKDGQLLDHLELPQPLELGDLQKNRSDDLQAITAVHESGHAVLSTILMKTLPKVVYSVLSESEQQGFIYSSYQWNYISRKEIIPRVAVMLGGYAAESVIFGEENLTAGANNDIEMATEFLTEMLKKNGMGEMPLRYSVSPMTESRYHDIKEIEESIRLHIEKALNLAMQTLKEEQPFLLALADYLADNRMIQKPDIRKIYEETGTKKVELIEKGNHLFYRQHLKNLAEENLDTNNRSKKIEAIYLNRNGN
jgi:cell division protease FtsH